MIQYMPFIGETLGRFFGNREKREEYQADARGAVYKQFANEFGHSRTWWDSLIDGLNRLPRPIMTFGTIWLFYYAVKDPDGFAESAQALQAMPKEGWMVLGAVVTFWFAAKLPKDFGRLKMYDTAAKEISRKSDERSRDVGWSGKVDKRYARDDYDNLN